jgi:putative endonuclease
MRQHFVYIVASKTRRLYTGVTNSLEHRVWQHRNGESRHTAKYNIIAAEKRIKSWDRAKRVALIESLNPRWKDLSEGWFDAKQR